MLYTKNEVIKYIAEENVKFIRLAFCDAFGLQKNIAITAAELERAFNEGISFDASAIRGFTGVEKSDMLLFPEPETLTVLPWRPSVGRVVRFFCKICYPDGTPYEADGRKILKDAVAKAKCENILCNFGSEFEFYLFKADDNGNPTSEPYDRGGYLDVAPLDKGENIRREIVLTLEEMGIFPESSHHEEGPGQNEVDFRYSDPLKTADSAITFKNVVNMIASRSGLSADFGPKPIPGECGNGFHINMSLTNLDLKPLPYDSFMAGILEHICEITAFLNPLEDSYKRLGEKKAPKYVTWSKENRSQLIRIPAAVGNHRRIELRSADCCTNPYLAFALLIHAGLDGMRRKLTPPKPLDINLYNAGPDIIKGLRTLPQSLEAARKAAKESALVKAVIPENILKAYNI